MSNRYDVIEDDAVIARSVSAVKAAELLGVHANLIVRELSRSRSLTVNGLKCVAADGGGELH